MLSRHCVKLTVWSMSELFSWQETRRERQRTQDNSKVEESCGLLCCISMNNVQQKRLKSKEDTHSDRAKTTKLKNAIQTQNLQQTLATNKQCNPSKQWETPGEQLKQSAREQSRGIIITQTVVSKSTQALNELRKPNNVLCICTSCSMSEVLSVSGEFSFNTKLIFVVMKCYKLRHFAHNSTLNF